MYITKIQATINVRETEGAIRNVHYKDAGKGKYEIRSKIHGPDCVLDCSVYI
jgi:acetone carboxylase gamma subunit